MWCCRVTTKVAKPTTCNTSRTSRTSWSFDSFSVISSACSTKFAVGISSAANNMVEASLFRTTEHKIPTPHERTSWPSQFMSFG